MAMKEVQNIPNPTVTQMKREPRVATTLPTFAGNPEPMETETTGAATPPPVPALTPSNVTAPLAKVRARTEQLRQVLSEGSGAGTSSPPTATSSEGSAASTWIPGGDPAEVAKVIRELTILAFAGAKVVLKKRRQKILRMPTAEQLDAWSEPLAQISVRHLPLQLLSPSLKDMGVAGKAGFDYVTDGPLTTPVEPETGELS